MLSQEVVPKTTGVAIAKDKNLETHGLFTKFVRIFTVPLLNHLPSRVIQLAMRKSSNDASTVVARGGSTHALEVMYLRHKRSIFSRGFLQGVADIFWHHIVSQPKALRNRLKMVECFLEDELVVLLKNHSSIRVLSIAGGSARAIVHVLDRLVKTYDIRGIHVTNIDKDKKALELGHKIAAEHSLGPNFDWIDGNALKLTETLNQKEFYDIVEMVGLLDYFSEQKGQVVFGQVHELLKPGGLFIVGNISNNREKPFIHKTGWPNMFYRTPEDLARLLRTSRLNKDSVILYEPLKVHLIAAVRK